MATLIKVDGSREEDVDISTLKKQQDLVGGYIEYAYLHDGRVLIVNEEGFLMHLEYNSEASEIYGHPIVGDVVLCNLNEIN